MEKDILLDLNDSQREAVVYCDGPSLVIAGAGSGKTRVLTYKIAYLLQKGMSPWNIMALTFTNKAARVMKERISALVGDELAMGLKMGTFHSIFSRILRREAQNIGYTSNYTIYDETDTRSLLKSIIKELELDDKVYKPAAVSSRISMAKNNLILASDYGRHVDLIERDKSQKMHAISHIYEIYQQRLKESDAMDFDDILVNTFLLFQDYEIIRKRYVEQIQYVLVDEYQDTNKVQQQILWQLTKERQKVCVVGDDAQSIYAFRGANIDNILSFTSQYENAKMFKLEQNYRSTQNIVAAANSLIKHNSRQISKDVFSKNSVGEKMPMRMLVSDREETNVVCNDIEKFVKKQNYKWSDCAILYRTNAQSRVFEEEMIKRNIPYRVYGGMSFYQRKEIKDILAYFRLVTNPNDEEAFKRIINYPTRGIGATTLQKIMSCARDNATSLWNIISHPDKYGFSVTSGTQTKLDNFRVMIESFREKLTLDALSLGQIIIKDSGLSDDLYADKSVEGLGKQENMEEFLSGIADFVNDRKEEDRESETTLRDYLQEISLITDLDSDDNAGTNRVSLMTVHSAKGLEFPIVFIVGLEENIFPSQMCTNNVRELEEERRLLYVAITRAEEHCLLSCAQNRFRYGKLEFFDPSRFIRDLDPELLSLQGGFMKKGLRDTMDFGSMGGFGSDRHPGYGRNVQNQHPVGFQFMADKKERITSRGDDYSSRRSSISNEIEREYGNKLRLKSVREKMKDKGFKTLGSAKLTTTSKSDSSLVDTIHNGSIIRHERFGIGTIVALEGTGENKKATVMFSNVGQKQLLLKFARFEIVK